MGTPEALCTRALCAEAVANLHRSRPRHSHSTFRFRFLIPCVPPSELFDHRKSQLGEVEQHEQQVDGLDPDEGSHDPSEAIDQEMVAQQA